eukprot:a265_249.p1 GENE.a265_249~~a265_249.p1  ORF type:complete len:324 (+),score=24.61 a265_249:65-973(+)
MADISGAEMKYAQKCIASARKLKCNLLEADDVVADAMSSAVYDSLVWDGSAENEDVQAAKSIARDVLAILSFVEANCGSMRGLEIEATDEEIDLSAAADLLAAVRDRSPAYVTQILRRFTVALGDVTSQILRGVLSKKQAGRKAAAAAMSSVHAQTEAFAATYGDWRGNIQRELLKEMKITLPRFYTRLQAPTELDFSRPEGAGAGWWWSRMYIFSGGDFFRIVDQRPRMTCPFCAADISIAEKRPDGGWRCHQGQITTHLKPHFTPKTAETSSLIHAAFMDSESPFKRFIQTTIDTLNKGQ